ncbi:MAG TPA: hypothetical protein VF304_09445 [Casimicrobiaceae bacterium]
MADDERVLVPIEPLVAPASDEAIGREFVQRKRRLLPCEMREDLRTIACDGAILAAFVEHQHVDRPQLPQSLP